VNTKDRLKAGLKKGDRIVFPDGAIGVPHGTQGVIVGEPDPVWHSIPVHVDGRKNAQEFWMGYLQKVTT